MGMILSRFQGAIFEEYYRILWVVIIIGIIIPIIYFLTIISVVWSPRKKNPPLQDGLHLKTKVR